MLSFIFSLFFVVIKAVNIYTNDCATYNDWVGIGDWDYSYTSASNCPGSDSYCWRLSGKCCTGSQTYPYNGIISTSGYNNIFVEFSVYFSRTNAEQGCFVDISYDGSSWNDAFYTITPSLAYQATVALPANADNNPNLNIRFRLDSYENIDNCYINDIRIYSTQTIQPTTSIPTTSTPTTLDPTSATPTTNEPTTSVPTTSNPTTSVPTTSVPTTTTPTTSVPTTSNPTSATPTSNAPTTSVPTTNQPTTNEPTTNEPTTNQPTTATPTTSQPTSNEPTTNEPTTAVPTTSQPTSNEPTTNEPTTAVPTTSQPTSNEPTTAVPTNYVPTTNEPTTAVPTASQPTTTEPTTSNPTIDAQMNDTQTKTTTLLLVVISCFVMQILMEIY